MRRPKSREGLHLHERAPGHWWAKAGGYSFDVRLAGVVWIVYVDGIERFSAYRLMAVEEKILGWLADREAATR